MSMALVGHDSGMLSRNKGSIFAVLVVQISVSVFSAVRFHLRSTLNCTTFLVSLLNLEATHISGLSQGQGGDRGATKELHEDGGMEKEDVEEMEKRIDSALLARLSCMVGSALVRMAR